MNKKQIAEQIKLLVASGQSKQAVFRQFSGQGVSDRKLAFLIAASVEPANCQQHKGKIKLLIILMCIQAVFGFSMGYSMGLLIGPNAKWVTAAVFMLIPLGFAYGFYKNHAGAYTAYIILVLAQIPKSLEGFVTTPIPAAIGLVIGFGVMALVWYVKAKLFPDLHIFKVVKKEKGEYVFST